MIARLSSESARAATGSYSDPAKPGSLNSQDRPLSAEGDPGPIIQLPRDLKHLGQHAFGAEVIPVEGDHPSDCYAKQLRPRRRGWGLAPGQTG
jgi:hypothetical protein